MNFENARAAIHLGMCGFGGPTKSGIELIEMLSAERFHHGDGELPT